MELVGGGGKNMAELPWGGGSQKVCLEVGGDWFKNPGATPQKRKRIGGCMKNLKGGLFEPANRINAVTKKNPHLKTKGMLTWEE